MANHKSAEKRSRQAHAQRLRNRINRTKIKTIVSKLDEAVASGSADAAQEALRAAISVVAKTASKGTIHKKTASRKISRLTKRVNAMNTAA
ncbi:MAG: 30S ribosomal protein S20 [Proteobacteria bacterium]|nr:30S ribosomal protein S20 [Pseudomonadota bacterium]